MSGDIKIYEPSEELQCSRCIKKSESCDLLPFSLYPELGRYSEYGWDVVIVLCKSYQKADK